MTWNKSVISAVSSVLTPFTLENMISIISEFVQPLIVIASLCVSIFWMGNEKFYLETKKKLSTPAVY